MVLHRLNGGGFLGFSARLSCETWKNPEKILEILH